MEDSLIFYEKEGGPVEKTHKILFTGLDGAGKTSIISAYSTIISIIFYC